MFITFEGIEGSGKSTLIPLVERDLTAAGENVLRTREPGGTPLGEAVRKVFLHDPAQTINPIAEVMLMNASRAQLCTDVIRPALRGGRTVISDRFYDATIAYQGYGRALEIEGLLQVCLVATGGLSPDLTFLLDITPEVSHERTRARAERDHHPVDRMESESLEFHRRVRDGYLVMARRWTSRFVVLDGTRPPEALVAEALAAIEHLRARIRTVIP